MISKWLLKGKILQIPKKDKDRIDLLTYLVSKNFEKGTIYSEKYVNKVLKFYHEDFSFLRRMLIEYKIMDRETDCSKYWVI